MYAPPAGSGLESGIWNLESGIAAEGRAALLARPPSMASSVVSAQQWLPKFANCGLEFRVMFPYDPMLRAAVQSPPQTIANVLETLQTIDAICTNGDGLKWFNWLYFQVTQAVEARVSSGGFADPSWLAELDVQFARLYFVAVESALSGGSPAGCWQILLEQRNQIPIARIQFALAGINAHINHDLPQAIVSTCQVTATTPRHDSTQYHDFTALNSTLDGLIQSARQTLHVRLLGDALPSVSRLDDTLAAWSVAAARESAWNNAELLWHLRDEPPLSSAFMDTLDGLTTVAGKTILVPVP